MDKITTTCSNCGATRDPILSTCLYCKAQFIQSESNFVSDEELISKAFEWLGRINQAPYTLENPHGKSIIERLMVIKTISKDEMISIVEKYLAIINIRAQTNPNMRIIYAQIRADLEKSKKMMTNNFKYLIKYFVFMGILAIGLFVLFHSCAKAQEKVKNAQVSKLNEIELKLENEISSGDLNRARVLIEQLTWVDIDESYTEVNVSMRKIYDDKRKRYLEILSEKRKN